MFVSNSGAGDKKKSNKSFGVFFGIGATGGKNNQTRFLGFIQLGCGGQKKTNKIFGV
jgi:hypothetical protein